jgi:hypothetical protein
MHIERFYYAEEVLHSKAGRIPIMGHRDRLHPTSAHAAAQETKKQ